MQEVVEKETVPFHYRTAAEVKGNRFAHGHNTTFRGVI